MAAESLHFHLALKDAVSPALAKTAAAFKHVDMAARATAFATAGIKPPASMESSTSAASAGLHQVAAAAGHARHEVEQLSTSGALMQAMGHHVETTRRHFEGLAGAVERTHGWLTRLLPMFGGLAGLTSLGGIAETVRHAVESASELKATAAIVGVTVGQWQQLAYTAKQTDVPLDSMKTGMERLNRAIGMAGAGKNQEFKGLIDHLKHLGYAVLDSSGHIKPALQLLPELAEAWKRTTSPAMRERFAASIGRSFHDLAPLLLEGREGVRHWGEEWEKYGKTLSDTDMEGVEKFRHSWNNLETAVGGFFTEVGVGIAPDLEHLTSSMGALSAANRHWLATEIVKHFHEFAIWAEKPHPDLQRLITDVEAFGKGANTVADAMGGWVRVTETLFGLWAISKVMGIVRAIGLIEGAAKLASAAMAGMRMPALLGAAAPAVPAAGGAVATVGTAAIGGAAAYTGAVIGSNVAAAIMHPQERAAAAASFAEHPMTAAEFAAVVPSMAARPIVIPHLLASPFARAPTVAPLPAGIPWPELQARWAAEDRAKVGIAPIPTAPAPFPNPFGSGSPAAAGAPAVMITPAPAPPQRVEGAVDVRVRFENAPAGMTVQTSTSGIVAAPPSVTGPAMPGARP